ncbi:MAG: hypothetical protein R3C59_01615 [Planctomycetaceae bacterium]
MKIATSLCMTILAASLCLVGCQDADNSTTTSAPVSGMPPSTMDDHDAHAHPSEGPHHGDLVELGNEEYHGEIVHSEATGELTIYILDGAAVRQVAIDATELVVNVKHEGSPKQFTLTASPDEGDETGRTSRFVSADQELSKHLDTEGTNPQMVVKINGKSYRGEIRHNHEGHDHAH